MNTTLDSLTPKEKDEYYKGCNKFIRKLDRKLARARKESDAEFEDRKILRIS